MDNGEIDLWGTHIPVLAACVAKTTGPVLELGCGHYSTRLLHALCGAMGRQLLTVDVNLKWLARFADLRAPLHEIVHTDVISQFVGCRISDGTPQQVISTSSPRAAAGPSSLKIPGLPSAAPTIL